MKKFIHEFKEFALKDVPTTEELFGLMSVRNLQRYISKETFAIRLEKNKQNWMKEWDIAVIVFEQLKNDCSKLEMTDSIEEYETLVNMIVKDQVGLEKCIQKLYKVADKYKNTISLAMEIEPSDEEFYTHMKHGIQKLKRNTQIILKIGGNIVK